MDRTGTETKTHLAALAVVPLEEVWEPIQAIRRDHDRHFGRWMPHVNLLYPFRPAERFDEAERIARTACAGIAPFEATLSSFRRFEHHPRNFTIWLSPDAVGPWMELQAALKRAFPDCDEISRFAGGFTPHLSVGQAWSEAEASALQRRFESGWKPVRFEVAAVAILARSFEGPFQIYRTVPLVLGPR